MKKILLSLIALVAFAFNASAAEVVGNEDNTTKFWSAFSESAYLLDGETLELSFTNYSDKKEYYDNWVAVCTNDVDRNDDANGYTEYFVLRADNYAWGTGGWNSAANPEKGKLTSNYNWDTFKEDMDGAQVDMTVSRKGNTISLEAVMTTTTGATYTETWVQTIDDLAEKVRFFLTVEGGHLVFQSDSDAEPTYTAKGTVSDYSASYANLKDVPALSDLTVEVYGANDSIVIRNWWGVEGYDIAIVTDSEGNVTTTPIVKGVPKHYDNANYSYVDTGLTAPSAWIVGVYDPYTWINTDDASTCGVLLTIYAYYDEAYSSSAWGYYYISWPVPDASGISSISADKSSVSGPAYNLAGQRVSKDTKGLVIMNGKKYFNK